VRLGIVEMTYALEIEDLTKSFGDKTVVNDVSFSVGVGDMFGFLGPNGSGKTTTIRIALGILRPDSGIIRLLNGLPAAEALRRVGYLPVNVGYCVRRRFPTFSLLGQAQGLSKPDALDCGLELLHRVGLYEHRDKKVEGLSR